MRDGVSFRNIMCALAVFFLVICLEIKLVSGAPKEIRKNIDPDFITVGVGGFDVNDDLTSGQVEIQARLNTRFWIFKPQAGMFVTAEEGVYAYFGIMTDLFFGGRFVISPSFGIGANHEGEGKQLGGAIEFRSAIEFAYRLDDRSRFGIQVGHLSNAGIYDENPGTEFAILNYSIPTTVFSR